MQLNHLQESAGQQTVFLVGMAEPPVVAAKKKRQRKSPNPKKRGTVIQKKQKQKQKGPVWTAPDATDGKTGHPGLDAQLSKPFVASVFIDAESGCFRFPVEGREHPHTLGGLHVRMRQKFFKNKELPVRPPAKEPRRLASSKVDGTRADRALEKAIKTGQAPPATSKYAAAVWKYWADNGHRPVLAQLPVVLPKQNIATAGDYFTVHTDPVTGEQRLHLWELKTGWPYVYKNVAEAGVMSAPLDHVWMTTWNRWQLQVLITQMAYERELGLVIDGGAHVLHAWLERPFGLSGYECRVNAITPEELNPPNWTTTVNRDAIYNAI